MEWPAYRVLCDQPDYWSGWMLDQCVELFEQLGDDTLAARLRSARAGEPLPVPDDLRLFNKMREIQFVFDPEG